jgi:membrane protein implicated in regulation of membrane protease activity
MKTIIAIMAISIGIVYSLFLYAVASFVELNLVYFQWHIVTRAVYIILLFYVFKEQSEYYNKRVDAYNRIVIGGEDYAKQ